MPGRIFHITARAHWQAAQTAGCYTAPSLAVEGFIHLSRADQVIGVANAFYRGQPGQVLLEVDTTCLGADLRWELPAHPGGALPQPAPPDGDLFPHLYGPLSLEAVVAVHDFAPGPDGIFTLPESLITNHAS